jgi:hypothetical protein
MDREITQQINKKNSNQSFSTGSMYHHKFGFLANNGHISLVEKKIGR